MDPFRSACLFGVLGALGVLAAVASTRGSAWRVVIVLGALMFYVLETRYFRKVLPTSELSLRPDGVCHYLEAGGIAWRGRLVPGGWHSRYVVLLKLQLPYGRIAVPVLRGRQRRGEYRRLRAWLRHRLMR